MNAIEKYINTDENAIYFFKTFVLDDESKLPFNKQEKYISNAEIFNAIKFLNYTLNGKKIKKNEFWKIISKEITFLPKNKYKHSLPTNIRSLERKYKNYIEIGYISLVHKGYGNCKLPLFRTVF
ncbi:hypothetical protein [Tenacibaculum maritimum]|uniref:hypothetical protein n=1 Tax=Tenacibaculum maritimum TaxID=107401 RepID=UPI001330D725|nr:hypothetical protein [Tenacibaculum maritimum]